MSALKCMLGFSLLSVCSFTVLRLQCVSAFVSATKPKHYSSSASNFSRKCVSNCAGDLHEVFICFHHRITRQGSLSHHQHCAASADHFHAPLHFRGKENCF